MNRATMFNAIKDIALSCAKNNWMEFPKKALYEFLSANKCKNTSGKPYINNPRGLSRLMSSVWKHFKYDKEAASAIASVCLGKNGKPSWRK